jgi:hypothetical protein
MFCFNNKEFLRSGNNSLRLLPCFKIKTKLNKYT